MASNPAQRVATAGRDTVRGAGDIAGKAAARTREEAGDIWAEAKNVARKDSGRDAAVYVGLAATTVVGVVELPVAAALGVGYAIFRRRR